MAVHDMIKETLAAHKRVVFNGNGYLIQEAIQVVNDLIFKYRAGTVVDNKFQWSDWIQIQTT